MANITKKQVESANAKLSNGFALDVWHYMTHGEKTAVKRVPLGGNAFACLKLMYMPEYEWKLTSYGKDQFSRGVPYEKCNGYRMETGRQIPCVHVSKELKDGEFVKSFVLGEWIEIGEPQDKKLFSTLQKLSAKINDDYFIAIANDEPNTLEDSKPILG